MCLNSNSKYVNNISSLHNVSGWQDRKVEEFGNLEFPVQWRNSNFKLGKKEVPSASSQSFFFIPALRQGPLSSEQQAMWMKRSQIEEINPM